MRNFCLAFALILLVQFINAQEMIPLWGEDSIGKNLALNEPISKTRDGVTRLSEVTNPRMQVFKPSSEVDNGSSIVICPGGGYSILAIDKEGTEIADWLNTLGYTAYVLEYRVPKQIEGAFQDVQRALRIVRAKTPQESKVGVLGFSAGGHLGASAATRYSEQAYEYIDEHDKQSARPDFGVLIYPAYLDKGENGGLTSEITLDSVSVPMFIFVAADDTHANSALVMASALQKNRTSVEFHMLPEGGHGYGLRNGNIAAETWPILLEKWLVKQH